jgi:AcrR family transcriptional regulator
MGPRRSLREDTKALFRSAILSAAEEVFAERGFHTARIADIAERARIAVGTVYNHFDQKDEVLTALLDERGDEQWRVFAARPDDPAEWEARLRARWLRLVGYIEQHRPFFRIACELGMFGAQPHKSIEKKARIAKEVRALLQEGLEAGRIEGDLLRLSRLFGGALRAVLEGALLDGAADLQAEAGFAIDFFLRAARRKGAR